jgi:hypothetical protein
VVNWRLILVLLVLVAFWLLVWAAVWHRNALPVIFSPSTAPVSPDELWTLNPV